MHTASKLILIVLLFPVICLANKGIRFEAGLQKATLQNCSGSLECIINSEGGTLTIGKEYDDLVQSFKGQLKKFSVSFTVNNLKNLRRFALVSVSYKDHIAIKVNGSLVWSSIGKDFSSLETHKTYSENIKEEKYEFFGLNGKSVETWKWQKQFLNIDAKKFLREGTNYIESTLATGKQGGVQVTFSAPQVAAKKIACQDSYRTCVKSGEQIVDGVRVTRDCWQYRYTKTCPYPSKDDCKKYSDCTLIAEKECLLKDKYGACVNLKREMSCEKPISEDYQVDVVGFDYKDKNSRSRLVCTGFPCIDGSCVNQESAKNTEMMEVLSKFGAFGKAKGGDMNAKVFGGRAMYCNNTRILGYQNCCKMEGWGQYLGAMCSAEEEQLKVLRRANKCVYVGKRKSKILGGTITTVTRNAWCCYNTVLDKLVQEQGRAQLGKNFGTGDNPDCEGLSLSEVLRLDFDKMDFSDFYTDILKQMKLPQGGELKQQIRKMMPQEYQEGVSRGQNNRAGTNKKLPTVQGDY